VSPTATSRGSLVKVLVLAAVVLGALLAVAETSAGPLDDADPARQRPGFLDGFGLPTAAPSLTAEVPRAGRRVVVFFERADRLEALCANLDGSDLADGVDLVLVVADSATRNLRCDPVTIVEDPTSDVSRAYGLRRPAGGGPPVGYAVVDSRGQLRYRTLDPAVADELSEVRTIVDAVP